MIEAWAELHQAELTANWNAIQSEQPRIPIDRYARRTHEMYDIVEAEVLGPYRIRVVFDDGLEWVVDLEPILYGGMFGPLRDPAFFAQMRLDPEWQTVVWPNDADFDPETLHNWDEYKDELAARARQSAAART